MPSIEPNPPFDIEPISDWLHDVDPGSSAMYYPQMRFFHQPINSSEDEAPA